jgi:hypothetical protein
MAYDPEVKAACMASLLAGQSLNEAAKVHEVPRSTLVRWRKEARKRLTEGLDDGAEVQPDDIGRLLVAYLAQGLRAATAIASYFEDEEWAKSAENASELAVAFGVISDKSHRLAEALEGGPVQPTASTNGHPRNRVRNHV